MSFIGTWRLWEVFGSCIPRCYGKVFHDLVYKPVGKTNPKGRLSTSKSQEDEKGFLVKTVTSSLPSYTEGGAGGI